MDARTQQLCFIGLSNLHKFSRLFSYRPEGLSGSAILVGDRFLFKSLLYYGLFWYFNLATSFDVVIAKKA